MTTYPVHYTVEQPTRFSRVQLLARALAFCILGMIGISFGAVFFVLFLALPVYAASRVAPRTEYVAEGGLRVLNVLRWFAAVAAWAGLIAEHLPNRAPDETVQLSVEGAPHQTPGHSLLRMITGLPSAFVLALLCFLGVFVWLWAALSILISERVGSAAFRYLVGLQRWSLRLLAYQASLVDEYPPFSFSESEPLPAAQVTA